METSRFMALAIVAGLFLCSCGDDHDDGGTAGGSGDAESTVAANTNSITPNIWLSASDFNCNDNWTERDGAIGLKAYSGPGTCTISFPGEEGTYNLTLSAIAEYDGKSLYRVSINGVIIGEGEYDLSSPLGCECPTDNWRQECPDRTQYIGFGKHNLKPGDVIEFWGDDVYPCGEHGAYAKWLGIQVDRT